MPADQTVLNHAARILASVTPTLPADSALRRYFQDHSKVSPGLRRVISRTVFIYYRWFNWLDSRDSLQRQLAQAEQVAARFDRDPRSIKPEALAARAVPTWAADEIEFSADDLRQLQRDPALWLRARPGTAGALSAALGDCEKTPASPDAVCYVGTQDLFRTTQFHTGAFEIQDLASQLVSIAAAPNPGETWWDACAGEGGKTLHLADLMANKGLIWATDRNERRLQSLKRRAARAKLFNFRSVLWDGGERLPTKTKFDGVLVDAPCSGAGTWQRNPHARWTTTADDVRELAATQTALLNHVAPAVKPGGRLIYAVCTLTRSETTVVAEAFTAAHPEFAPAPFTLPGREPADALHLTPHALNANGMFIAAWRRA